MEPFRFCPYDASALLPERHAEKVRPTCPKCGWVDWGNPKPTTAVLVQHRGKLLLGKRGVEPAKGGWDILGGFMEPGETAEQAAVREVEEESGLRVRIAAYLGTFPDLYGPDDVPLLNVAFLAVPCGDAVATPSSDVAELHWLLPEELPTDWPFAHQPLVIEAWRRRFNP